MQVFGGSLAEEFGTKIVLGLANTLTAIMALFIPYISKLDWQALLILRILQVSYAQAGCILRTRRTASGSLSCLTAPAA